MTLTETLTIEAAAEYLSRAGAWTLTVEGEGEHPGSLREGDEAKAIKWAEKLIRAGEYDLVPGESTTVRYSLRRGEVQLDRHVDVYRSEEEEEEES